VLEWECCLKHSEDGAAEGAPFIESHIIKRDGEELRRLRAGDSAGQGAIHRMMGSVDDGIVPGIAAPARPAVGQ
jgi:hypothetical protein